MVILKWPCISALRTWSSRKVEFLSEIKSFLPLKFEHGNYLFPVQRFLCTSYDPAEYCSSCISFNPTSHLKKGKIETDLHVKSTDIDQYLHYTFSHPEQTKRSSYIYIV